MPSVAVDDLWRAFAVQTREYAEFRSAAFGRPLPLAAEPARTAGGQVGELRPTFQLARQDEPGSLPALFRVDREVAVVGGRHYLADCGGRGVCYELAGTTCLQHLCGPGKPPGGRWKPQAPRAGELRDVRDRLRRWVRRQLTARPYGTRNRWKYGMPAAARAVVNGRNARRPSKDRVIGIGLEMCGNARSAGGGIFDVYRG